MLTIKYHTYIWQVSQQLGALVTLTPDDLWFGSNNKFYTFIQNVYLYV